MLQWRFFLAVLGTVVLQTSAVIIETMCHGHPPGTLLPNPQDCGSYYVCQSGPQLAYCSNGLHFDRIHKVCNWPDSANCQLEDVEQAEPEKTSHLEEEAVEKQLEDASTNQEQVNTSDNSKEPLKVVENTGNLLYTELSKEQISKVPDSGNMDSHEVGTLIVSSLSKDPSVENEVQLLPETTPSLSSIQVEVIVPAEIPNFVEGVAEPLEPIVNKPSLPLEIPQGEIVVEKEESLKPSKVIEILVGISNVEVSQLVEKVESPIASSNSNQVIELTLPVALLNSIVNAPDANPLVEKVDSSKPLQTGNQVIELIAPVLPMEVANTIVNAPDAHPLVEKVDSSKPLQTGNQVIELIVPGLPIEVENTIVNTPDVISPVDKVNSAIPSNNGLQVIELTVPSLPIVVENPIVNTPGEISKVDKDGTLNTLGNESQLTELIVDAANTIVNAPHANGNQVIELVVAPNTIVNVPDSMPQVDIEYSSKPFLNGNHIIEVVVPALPVEEPTTIVNYPDAITQAELFVEKEDSPKLPQIVNQVIELLPPTLSVDEAASIVNQLNELAVPAEIPSISAEKEEIFTDSKPSGLLSSISGPILENAAAHAEVDADKVETPPQVIEIPSPVNVFYKPIAKPELEKGDLSQSSVLIELSIEDSSVDAAESIEANPVILGGAQPLILTSSSEEDIIEKVEELINHASPNVSKSSEEDSVSQGIAENVVPSIEHSQENNVSPHLTESSEEDQHGETILEKVEISVNSSQSSKENQEPFVNEPLQPLSLPQNHEEKLEKPSKESSLESGEDHNISLESVATKLISSNLIISMLSVTSFQNNGSTNDIINRPIVGAHNIETGHPVAVMTGYNSMNVQCIHNGLYFLPHPNSCQKYFICAYRHLHSHSCGSGLIWNYMRAQCEIDSDSKCYSRATFKVEVVPVNTSAEDVTDIPVTKGQFASTPMPPLRTTLSTPASVSLDNKLPICPALRQIYLPSYDDCNRYYICILGQPVLTSCPAGMHWDAKYEFCGEPTVVRCANKY